MVFIRIMVVVEDMVVMADMADMVVDMVMEVEDIVAEDTEHLIKAVTGIKDQQTRERRDLLAMEAMEAMEVVEAMVVTGLGHMAISLGLGQCFTIRTSTTQPITWAIFLMDILYQLIMVNKYV